MINWHTSKEDHETICKIVDRAGVRGNDHRMLFMDLTACHANGNPLDLQAMLAGDDLDFSHDIYGIQRHINRTNGQLEDCFLPRFALANHITVSTSAVPPSASNPALARSAR